MIDALNRYRWFAELIELAIRGGFRLPISSPELMRQNTSQFINSAIMPSITLSHPGPYFHLAALCASERKKTYDRVKSEIEHNEAQVISEVKLETFAKSPAYAHEQTVNHVENILEVR